MGWHGCPQLRGARPEGAGRGRQNRCFQECCKRARLALKKKWSAKSKAAAAEYEQMLAARAKAKRAEQASKRSKRSGSRA